jgi:hypothetical protein
VITLSVDDVSKTFKQFNIHKAALLRERVPTGLKICTQVEATVDMHRQSETMCTLLPGNRERAKVRIVSPRLLIQATTDILSFLTGISWPDKSRGKCLSASYTFSSSG